MNLADIVYILAGLLFVSIGATIYLVQRQNRYSRVAVHERPHAPLQVASQKALEELIDPRLQKRLDRIKYGHATEARNLAQLDALGLERIFGFLPKCRGGRRG